MFDIQIQNNKIQIRYLELEHHCLAWTKLHVLIDKDSTTIGYICSLCRIADNLCITAQIELVDFILTIDDGHHILTLVLTGNNINTILRTELGLLSLSNYLIPLTPMQEIAQPVEHLVFSIRSSFCCESIMLITSPSTREVLRTLPSVTLLVPFIRTSVP